MTLRANDGPLAAHMKAAAKKTTDFAFPDLDILEVPFPYLEKAT